MDVVLPHRALVGPAATVSEDLLDRAAARPELSAGLAADPLIVEFFGAAGAGKSTLAAAVHERLRMLGLRARLVTHGRASDGGTRRSDRSMVLRQLSKFLATLSIIMPSGGVDASTRQVMAVIPTGNWIRTVRIQRYAVELCRSWRENQRPGEVMILDQGFVTLLCSMALQIQPIDRSALARGLAVIPRADLLVHVETPRPVVERRLTDRLRQRGAFERWYGNDLGTWMRQVQLASVLDNLHAEMGRAPIRVRSVTTTDVAAAVETIVGEIRSRRGDSPG